MKRTIFKLFVIALLFLSLQSCFQKEWLVLDLDRDNQPIQFGPHITSSELDTLGSISGSSTHEFEDPTNYSTYSGSIALGGTDKIKEDLNSTVYGALDDDPGHFIADGKIVLKIEKGISFNSIAYGFFLNMLGDGEVKNATYNIEAFKFKGIVYKYKKEVLNVEP